MAANYEHAIEEYGGARSILSRCGGLGGAVE
jgi:hypothetical protein